MDVFEQNLAVHGAGGVRAGWWLIGQSAAGELPTGGVDGAGPVLAGPFADRLDAETAALTAAFTSGMELAGGFGGGVRVAYGARGGDGVLRERSTPAERAWLAQLGQALEGLEKDRAALGENDPRVSLVIELVAGLTDAGLPLHPATTDSGPLDTSSGHRRGGFSGGVCLTPAGGGVGGVVVAWRCSDRLSLQQTSTAGVADAVQQGDGRRGRRRADRARFGVQPLTGSTAHLVTAAG